MLVLVTVVLVFLILVTVVLVLLVLLIVLIMGRKVLQHWASLVALIAVVFFVSMGPVLACLLVVALRRHPPAWQIRLPLSKPTLPATSAVPYMLSCEP
jgi:hypothetical protein